MDCPVCGSQLKSCVSKRSTNYVQCERWPECRTVGTPQVMNLLVHYKSEVQRLGVVANEQRQCMIAMLDKYAEAKDGRPVERLGVSVRLGDVIGDITAIAIERSKRKRNGVGK